MDRIDKIKLALAKGITCDINTGKVYGINGKEITKRPKHGYIIIAVRDDKYYEIRAHHLVWYMATGEIADEIDHRNGTRNDNRISNLRSVTRQENSFNHTDVKGYCFCNTRKKWKSTIVINRKQKFLGYFDTEEKAHQAYIEAKKIYHIIK